MTSASAPPAEPTPRNAVSLRGTRFPLAFAAVEGARAALQSIRAHGFRSFLTTLGIIIGVASVIAMVSIIQGLSYTIGQQFQGLGGGSLSVSSYTPMSERLQGRVARLTQRDLDVISHRVEGIASITPVMYFQGMQGQVRHGSQMATAQILGTTWAFQDIGLYYSRHGRFLSDSDQRTRRRVAVIGEDVRQDLGLPGDPVGEFVQISGEWLRVIGLFEPKGEILGQRQDNRVLIPYSTMQSLSGNRPDQDIQIQLTVADPTQMDAVIAQIRRLLRESRGLAGEVDDDFRVQTSEQLAATFDTILTNVTVVMGGIVGISLLVGGIGIMNIMLVSVTERTREIGICKAVGAKRHHILLQFLLEALVLCLLGGLAGLLFGYGIGALVASLIPGFPAAHTPLWAVMLALGFSLLVGVVFGILPAAKAANLDPITSLRYE